MLLSFRYAAIDAYTDPAKERHVVSTNVNTINVSVSNVNKQCQRGVGGGGADARTHDT